MTKLMMRTPKKTSAARSMFVLDRSKASAKPFRLLNAKVVESAAALRREFAEPSHDAIWISYDKALTQDLLKTPMNPAESLGEGVFVHELSPQSIAALASRFTRFAFAAGGGFLDAEQLAEVLLAPNRGDLLIGGFADTATETITLWRGDLRTLTVPFSAFPKSGDGVSPNFRKLTIIDSGQTIRLGNYEAAVDAILYEFDPEYRRRIKKRRIATERSFGASVRRLRKQRGLRREDFAPSLAAKTLARIEQGLVKRIHAKTRAALAAKLGVAPNEIESF